MTTAFDDVRLPEHIERGALVGPMFETGVVALSGGHEQRNQNWGQELLVADISYGLMQKRDPQDIDNSFQQIMSFFRARRGRHRHFRFRDASDFEAENQVLTAIDPAGLVFPVVKKYDNYTRRITRPSNGFFTIFVGGNVVPFEGNEFGPAWVLGELGVVTFVSMPLAQVTATYEFDVPMRFDSDLIQVNLEWQNAGSITQIRLKQVRE